MLFKDAAICSICFNAICLFFFLQAYLPSTFWLTLLDAFYQSLVCFFVPYFVSAEYEIPLYILLYKNPRQIRE